MKRKTPLALFIAALALHAWRPLPAQTLAQTPEAATATQAALQSATDALNAALLRGDANAALELLAPDFELGQHQYRKRDLRWMSQALPSQLARVRFTRLEVTLVNMEMRGNAALAHGRIEGKSQHRESGRGPGVSGDYYAWWVQTADGWRLKRGDAIFNLLLSPDTPTEPAPLVPPAPVTETKGTPDGPGLPRENPHVVLEQSHRDRVEPLAFSPDGATLATNGVFDGLYFSSAKTGAFQKAMPTPMSINSMTYAPDGTLVTGHNDGRVRLWNTASGTMLRELGVLKWSVYAVRVAPDGKTLAVDGAGQVQLWDIESGRKLRQFGRTPGNVRPLAFSPDGQTIALVSTAGVELWSTEGQLKHVLTGEWGCFLPDGKTLATSRFGTLRIYAIESGKVEREITVPNPFRRPERLFNGPISVISELVYEVGATLSPDGKTAASIYQDGSIGVWDTQSGVLRRHLRGFQADVMGGGISALTFSPDGATLAVGSRSGETALWSTL